MARLYADENVPQRLTETLRALGHDVLTALDDGRANLGIPDPDVLARAVALGRAVVTGNRRDFHQLHRRAPDHAGIITYTDDPKERAGLPARIHDAIGAEPDLVGRLVRVIRPNTPPPRVP